VATIMSAMSWLVGGFPDEAQVEIFATRDPRVSGVFSPTGTAVRKRGGYVVNRALGIQHRRSWRPLDRAERGVDRDGFPGCRNAASSRAASSSGSTIGTQRHGGNRSSTVVAKDVFVPAHRVLPLPEMVEGRYPQRHNSGNPYYNYPLAAVLTANAAARRSGIARGALELFRDVCRAARSLTRRMRARSRPPSRTCSWAKPR